MTAASTRIVIADDHPLFRGALRQAVTSVVPSAMTRWVLAALIFVLRAPFGEPLALLKA